jgi:hypothetical protein
MTSFKKTSFTGGCAAQEGGDIEFKVPLKKVLFCKDFTTHENDVHFIKASGC